MIPRKKFRFGEREAVNPAAPIALTNEDAQNLDAYVGKIKETVTILRREIDAIKAGELEVVGQVYEEKSKVLKWLELRTPLIEPFLHHEAASNLGIREHLAVLKKNIEEDDALLSRMAVAARTVLREVEKITNRNGLSGVYGKSGHKRGAATGGAVNLDQEL